MFELVSGCFSSCQTTLRGFCCTGLSTAFQLALACIKAPKQHLEAVCTSAKSIASCITTHKVTTATTSDLLAATMKTSSCLLLAVAAACLLSHAIICDALPLSAWIEGSASFFGGPPVRREAVESAAVVESGQCCCALLHITTPLQPTLTGCRMASQTPTRPQSTVAPAVSCVVELLCLNGQRKLF